MEPSNLLPFDEGTVVLEESRENNIEPQRSSEPFSDTATISKPRKKSSGSSLDSFSPTFKKSDDDGGVKTFLWYGFVLGAITLLALGFTVKRLTPARPGKVVAMAVPPPGPFSRKPQPRKTSRVRNAKRGLASKAK